MYNKELKQTQISQTAIFTTGSMRASKILPSFILVLTVFFSDYFFNYGKDIRLFFLKTSQPITEIPVAIENVYDRLVFFFSTFAMVIFLQDKKNIRYKKVGGYILYNTYARTTQNQYFFGGSSCNFYILLFVMSFFKLSTKLKLLFWYRVPLN